MNTMSCKDIETFGNCLKKGSCPICNKDTLQTVQQAPVLNVKAKEFVPKKKLQENTTQNTESASNNSSQNLENQVLKLNLNASEYVPSNKFNQNSYSNQYSNSNGNYNQNGNLNGNYYSQTQTNNQEINGGNMNNMEGEDDCDPNEDELDMIMKDIMEQEDVEEDEESDDDKWYPKFQNCECCKGHVFKCKGSACQYLGACYCKVKSECDDGN